MITYKELVEAVGQASAEAIDNGARPFRPATRCSQCARSAWPALALYSAAVSSMAGGCAGSWSR